MTAEELPDGTEDDEPLTLCPLGRFCMEYLCGGPRTQHVPRIAQVAGFEVSYTSDDEELICGAQDQQFND